MSAGSVSSSSAGSSATVRIPEGYHVLDKKAFERTVALKALKVRAVDTRVVLSKIKVPGGSKTGPVLLQPNIHVVEHATEAEGGADFRVILLSPQGFDLGNGGLFSDSIVPGTHCLTADHLESLKDMTHSFVDRTITIGYDQMSSDEILRRVLPAELEQIPSSFETIGSLAHINLRAEYELYKYTIGQVLLDKNVNIRTVLNKTGNIDTTFRTFPMEVLAGVDTTTVDIKHAGARFHLDFRKVYWNSRLAHEHELIATKLIPQRSLVADMFAGVGPFAVPLAVSPRDCVVYANDLNPESYKCMIENARRNKVEGRVFPHNLDGREFIRTLASKNVPFQYVIMNLPADAASFLDVFAGCFKGLPETVPALHRELLAAKPAAAAVPKGQHQQQWKGNKNQRAGAAAAASASATAAALTEASASSTVAVTMIPRPLPYIFCHAFCKTHTFEDAVADITRRTMLRLGMIKEDELFFSPPCYDAIGNEVLRSKVASSSSGAGAEGEDEDNDDLDEPGTGAGAGAGGAGASSSSSLLKFKSSEAKKAVPEEIRQQAALARKAIADHAAKVLPDLTVREVRNVAPNKVMVCVQFTVPKDVLYGSSSASSSSSSSSAPLLLPAKRSSPDGADGPPAAGEDEEGAAEPMAKRGKVESPAGDKV